MKFHVVGLALGMIGLAVSVESPSSAWADEIAMGQEQSKPVVISDKDSQKKENVEPASTEEIQERAIRNSVVSGSAVTGLSTNAGNYKCRSSSGICTCWVDVPGDCDNLDSSGQCSGGRICDGNVCFCRWK